MFRNKKTIFKLLTAISVSFSFFLLSFTSLHLGGSQKQGSIEGYICPKEAKPFVQIALPHPTHVGDTIHKEFHPNAQGFFKIPNLDPGTYDLTYFAKDRSFKRKIKSVSVRSEGTADAGVVTLEK